MSGGKVRSRMTTRIEDGIATLVIDQPESKVNVMGIEFIQDLDEALSALPADLRGLVLISGKEGQFVAGADLEMLLQVQDPRDAEEVVRRLHRVLDRLARLPYPSVAAIGGPALGGGLELALACDYRVAAESDTAGIGLPEVQLGLIPAGGGTQRLPRLIGLTRALSLILESKRLTPRRARKYGVIDDLVHPAILESAARSLLTRGKRAAPPAPSRIDRAAERFPLLRTYIYRQAEKNVRKRTRGHYPAPLAALEAVRAGQEQGLGAGLAAEAVAFGTLATGPVARNLIELFFATEGLKRDARSLGADAHPVERIGVIGAGFMGAGIAQAAAVAGYEVRLRDIAPESVARGLKTVRGLTSSAARKGRFSRSTAAAILARVSGTTDYSGFGRADLAIEAVFEDIEVKRRVIAELEDVLPSDAIIASNTSSLPIAELAAKAKRPDRIVGMHFFSPVHKMPLLEVIRAGGSSQSAVATAVQTGQRLGKTVIVVRDGPGFYTTRVLGFMVGEAGRLVAEGAAIEDVDRAMTAFGFPVGPLALSDEVGLDVAAHISTILDAAFDRFQADPAIGRMVEEGRLGRKSGRGFYDYSGRKKRPDPALYAGRPSQHFPRELIQRRLALAFVNEAVRCLEEGIIASPRDGDVGAILGLGFPPFLGGPFRYTDSLGAAAVVDQLRQLEYAYGAVFTPAPLLEEMAAGGSRFYAAVATEGEAREPELLHR